MQFTNDSFVMSDIQNRISRMIKFHRNRQLNNIRIPLLYNTLCEICRTFKDKESIFRCAVLYDTLLRVQNEKQLTEIKNLIINDIEDDDIDDDINTLCKAFDINEYITNYFGILIYTHSNDATEPDDFECCLNDTSYTKSELITSASKFKINMHLLFSNQIYDYNLRLIFLILMNHFESMEDDDNINISKIFTRTKIKSYTYDNNIDVSTLPTNAYYVNFNLTAKECKDAIFKHYVEVFTYQNRTDGICVLYSLVTLFKSLPITNIKPDTIKDICNMYINNLNSNINLNDYYIYISEYHDESQNDNYIDQFYTNISTTSNINDIIINILCINHAKKPCRTRCRYNDDVSVFNLHSIFYINPQLHTVMNNKPLLTLLTSDFIITTLLFMTSKYGTKNINSDDITANIQSYDYACFICNIIQYWPFIYEFDKLYNDNKNNSIKDIIYKFDYNSILELIEHIIININNKTINSYYISFRNIITNDVYKTECINAIKLYITKDITDIVQQHCKPDIVKKVVSTNAKSDIVISYTEQIYNALRHAYNVFDEYVINNKKPFIISFLCYDENDKEDSKHVLTSVYNNKYNNKYEIYDCNYVYNTKWYEKHCDINAGKYDFIFLRHDKYESERTNYDIIFDETVNINADTFARFTGANVNIINKPWMLILIICIVCVIIIAIICIVIHYTNMNSNSSSNI